MKLVMKAARSGVGRDVKVTVISFGISSNDICTHGVS